MKSCHSCYYAAHVDQGWSNYTVEGTTFYCLLKKGGADGFDEFYGEDDRMAYAEQCGSFHKSEGFTIDVEWKALDDYRKDNDERVALWDALGVE
jgi:hypothetical protein